MIFVRKDKGAPGDTSSIALNRHQESRTDMIQWG
jgi:hypothetical protein